jgi:O-acetyl-ADP-ribose deacetylase (regulator of RNase III)
LERVVVGQTALELVQGDITQQDTDAIVNAVNRRLAPGGGVAGAVVVTRDWRSETHRLF